MDSTECDRTEDQVGGNEVESGADGASLGRRVKCGDQVAESAAWNADHVQKTGSHVAVQQRCQAHHQYCLHTNQRQ